MADRVIIKNLDFNMAHSKGMSELFQRHGFQNVRPEDVYIHRSGTMSNTPGKMCVGFVSLSSDAEVQAAIDTFHAKVLQGLSDKPVAVQRAVPRLSTLRSSPSTPGAASAEPHLAGTSQVNLDAAPGTSEGVSKRWAVEEIYTDPSCWKKKKKKNKDSKRKKDAHPEEEPEPEELPWVRRQKLRSWPVD